MKKGKIIVIEGACDGIGKSTQFNLLKEKLIEDGYKIVSHHFPSYKETQGQLVEKYLAGELGNPFELSPYFINSLYASDRYITWNNELKRFYDDGYIILLDRYTQSSMMYQSAFLSQEKRILFADFVYDYEFKKLKIGVPDLVLFLTAEYDLIKELRFLRNENDGIKNDVYERNEELMKKVYKSGQQLATYYKWNKVECLNNQKLRNANDIHKEIYEKVLKIVK